MGDDDFAHLCGNLVLAVVEHTSCQLCGSRTVFLCVSMMNWLTRFFPDRREMTEEEARGHIIAGLLESGVSLSDYPPNFADGVRRLVDSEIEFLVETGQGLNARTIEKSIRELRGAFWKSWFRLIEKKENADGRTS